MSRTRNHRRAGFTLIEVLAAMVLLAIVVPVAMRGIQLSLQAASKARNTSMAASLAETKLNELLTQSATSSSSLSGDFAPDYPQYHWTYESAPRDYGVTEVQLKVTWLERGMPAQFALSTMTYQNDTGTGATAGVTP